MTKVRPIAQLDMFAAETQAAKEDYYLYQVSGRGFVAGIIFEKRKGKWVCCQAAPIVRYLVGWEAERVKEYIDKRKWGYEKVEKFDTRTKT